MHSALKRVKSAVKLKKQNVICHPLAFLYSISPVVFICITKSIQVPRKGPEDPYSVELRKDLLKYDNLCSAE